MINDLLQQFMSSPAAAEAMQQLQQSHGLSPDQARAALESTADAHGQHAAAPPPQGDGAQALGFGAFGNAVAGGLGGAVASGGIGGILQGGLSGMIAGKAAEMLAKRTGMSPSTASSVAAAAAPFLLKYLQGGGASQQAAGPQSMTKETKPLIKETKK